MKSIHKAISKVWSAYLIKHIHSVSFYNILEKERLKSWKKFGTCIHGHLVNTLSNEILHGVLPLSRLRPFRFSRHFPSACVTFHVEFRREAMKIFQFSFRKLPGVGIKGTQSFSLKRSIEICRGCLLWCMVISGMWWQISFDSMTN